MAVSQRDQLLNAPRVPPAAEAQAFPMGLSGGAAIVLCQGGGVVFSPWGLTVNLSGTSPFLK